MNLYYVYILSNYSNSTLYIGVTNNLKRRIYEHKNKVIKGFSEKYNLNKLVYYEEVSDIKAAIQREKNLKRWNRQWKKELIEKINPEYKDLSVNFGI
ncbi:GIY-YIG nuclease family protein [Treponema sp. C6A8]|uniref:GIY-YIG nuclease family protein n=1 Tax=Treponema sp. C6A8 TaxID=1410609 RepID=UPI000481D241|nr:GIY-YIG nuclease family protein [Treponema sp. C6A8]